MRATTCAIRRFGLVAGGLAGRTRLAGSYCALLMLACLWACATREGFGSPGRGPALRPQLGTVRTSLSVAAFPMCAELFRAALGAKSEHTFGEGGARTARGGWGIINRTGDLMGVAAGWDLGAAGPLLKRHGVPQATAPDFEIAIAPRPTSRDHARARRTG